MVTFNYVGGCNTRVNFYSLDIGMWSRLHHIHDQKSLQ